MEKLSVAHTVEGLSEIYVCDRNTLFIISSQCSVP